MVSDARRSVLNSLGLISLTAFDKVDHRIARSIGDLIESGGYDPDAVHGIFGNAVMVTFAVAAAALAAFGPVACIGAATVTALLFYRHLKVKASDRKRGYLRSIPEMVDLLAIAASAGLNPYRALDAVVDAIDGPLGDALALAMADVRTGMPVGEAIQRVATKVGIDDLRVLSRAIASAERQGTPLAPTLRRLSETQGEKRRRAAEGEARKAPVRILFPLVTCVLPAFVLLTVVPVFVDTFRLVKT